MRIPRLFVDQCFTLGAKIQLPPDCSHKIARVLRLKAGHLICLFNGKGGEYQACIQSSTAQQVEVLIVSFHEGRCPPPHLSVHLLQGIARGEKMDWMIQKSVELGVTHITPLFTERGQIQKVPDKRLVRWERIARQASEQSGRVNLPKIDEPISFYAYLKDRVNHVHSSLLSCLLDPQASETFKNLLKSYQGKFSGIEILVGPEGGFAEQEKEKAQSVGYEFARLSSLILRAETAALVALSQIL